MKFLILIGVFFLSSIQAMAQRPDEPFVIDSLTDDQIAGYCLNIQDETQLLMSQYADSLVILSKNHAQIEEALAAAEQDTLSDKMRIKTLRKELKQARSVEKNLSKRKESAENLHAAAAALAISDSETQRKSFLPLWNQVQKWKGVETVEAKPEKKGIKRPQIKKKPVKSAEKSIVEMINNAEKPADTAAVPEKVKRRKKDKNADVSFEDTTTVEAKPEKRRKKDKTDNIPAEDTTTAEIKPEKRRKIRKEDQPQSDTNAIITESAIKRPPSITKKFKIYNPLEDVIIYPPIPPCVLVQDTRDDFSGEIRRATDRAELFRHTNPLLKNYMQGIPQVVCEASMSKAGALVTLHLHLMVNDANTRRAQGNLPKNSNAIFKLIDGTTYHLFNLQADEGKSDAAGQGFVYEGLFSLDRDAIRKLRNIELDKIRLNWANGYEDYEVHDIRLLMRQLACIAARE